MYGSPHKVTIERREIGTLADGKRGEVVVSSKVVKGFMWIQNEGETLKAQQVSDSQNAVFICDLRTTVSVQDRVIASGIHDTIDGTWSIGSITPKMHALWVLLNKDIGTHGN